LLFSISLPVARILQFGSGWESECGNVMDPKLAFFALLFGGIIGLSYLTADNMARFKRWRKTAP
jgi:hypothetical protein